MTAIDKDSPRPLIFPLTWLTCTPLLRGNWVAIGLSLVPAALSLLALAVASALEQPNQGVALFSSALFLSLSATLIQVPAYLGHVLLTDEHLTVAVRFSGRRGQLRVPRQAIRHAVFEPLNRPPAWLPFAWALVELLFAMGAASAGWGGGGGQWTWLTALAAGLSVWPLMVARWQARTQVILTYNRADGDQPGLIRAWATPQQAGSLIHTLEGRIDWDEPQGKPDEEQDNQPLATG